MRRDEGPPPDDAIEEAVVRAFFVPHRRARFIQLLRHPQRRTAALFPLDHNAPLDPRYAHLLEDATTHGATSLTALLTNLGAPPHCYAISTGDLDRKTLPLEEALWKCTSYPAGTILSCVHGRLGFYQGEDPEERRILFRQT